MTERTSDDLPPLFSSLPAELALLVVLDRPDLLEAIGPQVDWSRVLGLARHHRLSGLLATALQAAPTGRSVPEAVMSDVLAERDQRLARFETMVLPQLEEVCAALASLAVCPVLLKGAALVCSGQLSGGERPLGDLDLLVSGDDLPVVTAVMEDLGYRPRVREDIRGWARANHYQDPAWYHSERPLGVEVHWALQEPTHRLAFDEATLEVVELRLDDGTRVSRLSDRDLLTHLCLHFWRDRADGGPGALGQLWDVRRTSPPSDHHLWSRLRVAATERGHAQVLAAVLACSHLLLGGPLPEAFPEVRAMARTNAVSSYAIRRVLAPRPTGAQLVMVTPDVDYRLGRMLNRVVAQYRKPPPQLREAYGDGSTWRLRLGHARKLTRLLLGLFRSPLDTREELRLDRWAHRLR